MQIGPMQRPEWSTRAYARCARQALPNVSRAPVRVTAQTGASMAGQIFVAAAAGAGAASHSPAISAPDSRAKCDFLIVLSSRDDSDAGFAMKYHN